MEEQKLEAHSDWVRDVAWAPSVGLPKSVIASCSQVGVTYLYRCHHHCKYSLSVICIDSSEIVKLLQRSIKDRHYTII